MLLELADIKGSRSCATFLLSLPGIDRKGYDMDHRYRETALETERLFNEVKNDDLALIDRVLDKNEIDVIGLISEKDYVSVKAETPPPSDVTVNQKVKKGVEDWFIVDIQP